MKTNVKVSPITIEMLLNHPDKSYNESIWKDRITSVSKYKNCQFYICEKGNGYDYERFYASYIADGIYFFSEFNPYHSSLTSNGFCKIFLDIEGFVNKILFKDESGKEGYANNDNFNRNLFRKNLTPYSVMVSNNFSKLLTFIWNCQFKYLYLSHHNKTIIN